MLSRNCRRLLQVRVPAVSRCSISYIPCKNVRATSTRSILHLHRYLSSAATNNNNDAVESESASKAPRGLPTKHSRHLPPPVAPAKILDDSSEDILKSIPGTLFGKYT